MELPSTELTRRMAEIREKRISRLHEINEEVSRMTDWREHVRATPITAVLASAMVGAIAGKAILDSTATPPASQPIHTRARKATFTSKVLSNVVALALPIVTNAMKAQVSNVLSNLQTSSVGNHHDKSYEIR